MYSVLRFIELFKKKKKCDKLLYRWEEVGQIYKAKSARKGLKTIKASAKHEP